MHEKYPYQKQWEEYRRLKNRQYIIFIGGGIIINLPDYFHNLRSIQLILIIGWVVALIYVIFRFHTWKCPGCEKRFFVSSFWIRHPELLSNCRNCDLRKYKGSAFEKK
ncbi:MAG: hypothetical protein WA584_09285 [Pyrinomonadaceae bacterium]